MEIERKNILKDFKFLEGTVTITQLEEAIENCTSEEITIVREFFGDLVRIVNQEKEEEEDNKIRTFKVECGRWRNGSIVDEDWYQTYNVTFTGTRKQMRKFKKEENFPFKWEGGVEEMDVVEYEEVAE